MNAVASGPVAQLQVGDAILVQRVVTHVLASQAAGNLPWLSWHSHISASDRLAMHARWPLPCALWEDHEDRGNASQAGVGHANLLRPLHDLLLAHRSSADQAITVLANVLASACFGSHHLWEDLGATGRDEVSCLMQLGFSALHESNHRNLRWKRHLFLVLGDHLGKKDLRPPKCDHCDGYEACFGSPVLYAPKTWPLKSGH